MSADSSSKMLVTSYKALHDFFLNFLTPFPILNCDSIRVRDSYTSTSPVLSKPHNDTPKPEYSTPGIPPP